MGAAVSSSETVFQTELGETSKTDETDGNPGFFAGGLWRGAFRGAAGDRQLQGKSRDCASEGLVR